MFNSVPINLNTGTSRLWAKSYVLYYLANAPVGMSILIVEENISDS